MALHIRVLGAAAGGGFPQWNANNEACRRARLGENAARPATQASLAVSTDGRHWVLLNASPDLRQQILANSQLHPQSGLRDSPIRAVILTNGDVDAIAGLLCLRERQPIALYATGLVLSILAENPIFAVLAPQSVERRRLMLEEPMKLRSRDGMPLGLVLEAFSVPGKVPLYLESGEETSIETACLGEETIGIKLSDLKGRSFFFIPSCAAMTAELADRLAGARLVFFDGTLWRDDEMIREGSGTKTGRRMGHMSASGPDGAIAAFSSLGVERKIFIHINNSNPLLLADSQERAEAAAFGWEVAEDGMGVIL
ncbi:MAG TPA: pyrroloquinoline quinone biosynthesis protein PqqB [Sinorhizobium sp.]|nr:pyrroloquinoline quinone biosynthesis protein PqqB [Sinorhizobium sp.]